MAPLGGLVETKVFPHSSVAVGWYVTTAPQTPESLFTVIFAGQVMTGGCTSWVVMIWVQLLLFPHESDAVNVRVMVWVFPHPGTDASLNVIAGPLS